MQWMPAKKALCYAGFDPKPFLAVGRFTCQLASSDQIHLMLISKWMNNRLIWKLKQNRNLIQIKKSNAFIQEIISNRTNSFHEVPDQSKKPNENFAFPSSKSIHKHTWRYVSFKPFCLPVFVSDEERSFDIATVWILSLAVEHLFVVLVVVQIHCTVERQQNYLWCLKLNGERAKITSKMNFNECFYNVKDSVARHEMII